MYKKIVALLFALVLVAAPYTKVDAKTVNKYATQTVTLKQKANTKSKTAYKVKRNTKLSVQKQGKTWATVNYKNQKLYVYKKYLSKKRCVKKYTGRQLRWSGVIRWSGYRYTWYSQRVLPGRGLKIPGRHVDSQGYVCDKYGYIVVGSSISNKKKKVIVPTPFGKFGKCYDCGAVGSNHFDVYTAW